MHRVLAVICSARRASLLLSAAAFGLLLLTGCVSAGLASRMVKAPNADGLPHALRDPKLRDLADRSYNAHWRVAVGPPAAELAVGVVEPADYDLNYDVQEVRQSGTHGTVKMNLSWHPFKGGSRVPARTDPKGTILLLHGVMMYKEAMHPWAFYFARHGYRTVMVDLRGHGRSTGSRITYGAAEVHDLQQVLDDLQRRGLLTGRLGVFGQSYGGALAILLAARDPRVEAVIAMAPYDDPQSAIPDFVRAMYPKLVANVSDRTFAVAMQKAARLGHFAWPDVNVIAAARQMRAPILLLHGAQDDWVSPRRSEAIAAAARSSARVVTPNDNHMTLMLRFDRLGPRTLAWWDEKLTGAATAAGSVSAGEGASE